MDDIKEKLKEILVREPYFNVLPQKDAYPTVVRRDSLPSEPNDKLMVEIVTQADFLRQLYPSGHKIFDKTLYPDVWKQDPENKRWYSQPITRCAFAFQNVIKTKQVIHLVGNDVNFELSEYSEDEKVDTENTLTLLKFKKGWIDCKMEYHLFEAIDAIKSVGDAAIVGFFTKDGSPAFRAFSYLKGDTLYPHYDGITGELELFARKYYALDESGDATTEYVEVWDETYMYRCKRGLKGRGIVERIKDLFGLSGFEVTEKIKHGFNCIPVAYYRDPIGACWSPAQQTIETYEESFSYFAENNKSSAFPIFYVKGENAELVGDLNGAVKSVLIPDPAGEAGFLDKADVSTAFNTQLKTLYDMIYEQSFSVKPPELKSGDLPGVALKLLYSPAIERAICDTQALQPFLEKLVYMVKYAVGYNIGEQATMLLLGINAWIEPYIHQNDTELVTNLAQGVQNGFLSKQTASERNSKYAKNDEIGRIIKEDIEKRELDLKYQTELQIKQTEQRIKEMEEQAHINKMNGQDINTGQGQGAGRPNRSGKQWDENGNNPIDDKNNWDK